MASGTADLQRDLGGAIMQSILGALLTAGYASALGAHRRLAGRGQGLDSEQSTLTKSFASAEAVAAQYPQYSSQIITAARKSFVDGQDWAYIAGTVAVVLGQVAWSSSLPKHGPRRRCWSPRRRWRGVARKGPRRTERACIRPTSSPHHARARPGWRPG